MNCERCEGEARPYEHGSECFLTTRMHLDHHIIWRCKACMDETPEDWRHLSDDEITEVEIAAWRRKHIEAGKPPRNPSRRQADGW